MPATSTFPLTTAIARDAMHGPVTAVDPSMPLRDVASALVAHECSHAVVVEDERPVGIISTFDLARVLGL